MNADDFLQHAAAVVRDRRCSYGDPTDLFERVAVRWSQVLGTKVTAAQVGLCLIDLKLARLAHDPAHLRQPGRRRRLRRLRAGGHPMSALARIWRSNATPEELEALRQRAWRQQGVLVLWPDEIRDGWVKQALIDEAVRRYGPRPERGR